ncbi:MAG: hypothetical protein KatS3mg061_0112 [Dehalococcoidia bacterium]|nr:MAG: hypothetical protein KatS3mg061_0112 [Dehalococcoidia bacterium]
MDLQELIGLAGVPVIVALVQLVKPWVSDSRWHPWLAVGWGVGLNLAAGVLLGNDPARTVLTGLVAGLAAAGLYDSGRAVFTRMGSRAQ